MFQNADPRRKRIGLAALAIILLAALAAVLLLIKAPAKQPDDPAAETVATQPQTASTQPTEATEPETVPNPVPEHVVSTATISTTGDLLMHLPVVNAHAQGDGTYNFDRAFQYLKSYSEAADYAVANLETTLAGLDGGYKYSGIGREGVSVSFDDVTQIKTVVLKNIL